MMRSKGTIRGIPQGVLLQVNAGKLTKTGIKSSGGRDVRNKGTIISILMNETYKGRALLRRHNSADCRRKKIVRNDGAVPRYCVEDCHEAIIEPETFERVQEMIEQRGIRRREFERFFSEPENLPEAVSEFDDALRGSLAEYVTVGKAMAFAPIGGTETGHRNEKSKYRLTSDLSFTIICERKVT